MPFTLTMPKLSPTMEEGTIVLWHKKEGEYVKAEELLLEVATDKATVEYTALDSGWLRKILIPQGKEVKINDPIAIFTEEQHESIEGFVVPVEDEKVFSATPPVEVAKNLEECPQDTSGTRIKASPLARKLAKQKRIDLATVKGSGPGGRIMSRDLVSREEKKQTEQYLPSGSFQEEQLTPIGKVMSRRLKEAKTLIPHFYVSIKVNAQPLFACRDQLKKYRIPATFNDFVVRASALALRQHPSVNSAYHEAHDTLIRYKTIDISVAVSLPKGLITPIVKHADQKSLSEISQEVKELATKAKEGKLQESEYKGGSFTISNLGMYGVADFIAIINSPQAAILAVSGILDVPVVCEGKVVPGKEMMLTLSGDHRVIDGVAGAEFLNTLKGYLEHPAVLLLEKFI